MIQAPKNIDSSLTMAPTKARLVFDLFNEQKLHPFYDNSVDNELTQCSYQVPHYHEKDQKSSLFEVFDIPAYILTAPIFLPKKFATKSIRQYKGFLINLCAFASADEYLAHQLSKRSRKRLRKKVRNLEQNHSISFNVHHGAIDRQLHAKLMKKFHDLLKKRFDEKKIHNKYLERWDYYNQLSFEKINQGLASLFVIYDSQKPICITLNFHLKKVIFSELEGFDTDYSDYGLGDISMLKHLQWCFENNVRILDLSMGKTNFKNKWCNQSYDFYHHLHYNKKNLASLILMLAQWSKLSLKQFLRDLGILGGVFRYDKLQFMFKANTGKIY
ncbi:GNAT family N-acetyltransferase [Allomuricauda sp. SCSIO 65647]|uniref:GNAT family N-acetyltransferase n=1 Tax=Allomuricauda sp. SCSIO 65647 TaxID=2908843 RepID=UPI001F43E885|nr:GNAT family N-acetyltransferase [Muricauda sp. SCSIO 65647]UJH67005.1 GNAT family N-acetyltransferase [Muricauda sp. SCSIO 65647]